MKALGLFFQGSSDKFVYHYEHQIALSGDANDTTGRASTSIASLLALLAVTLAEVIGTGVDDKSPAEDALGADELDELVGDGALGVALTVSLVVAQVTYMALRVGWGAVGLVLWVDCSLLASWS